MKLHVYLQSLFSVVGAQGVWWLFLLLKAAGNGFDVTQSDGCNQLACLQLSLFIIVACCNL